MENKFNYIIYPLSIIFAVISDVFMVIFAALGIMIVLNANVPEYIPVKYGPMPYFILAAACFGLDRLLFSLRTGVRNKIEFDENGKKKNNLYKNLSSADKAVIDKQMLLDSERILSESEFKKVIHKGVRNPQHELDKLIGLANLKNEIKKMEATMEYAKTYEKNKKHDIASNHMCFMGSPGTGKTTVARIMTRLLYKYKYIKKNQCIEVDASFLKGDTPDNTLKKVRMVLQRSKGGVLFIDEAYSLLDGINSKEIVAELVKFMEDNKKDFVLILAGYQNEMKELINSNPGLYSRINKYFLFKDYDINELKDIFRLTANEAGFYVESDAYDAFEIKINKEKK